MPKKYYMHGEEIAEDKYLEMLKASGASADDFNADNGVGIEETEDPVDYTPERKDTSRDSIDKHHLSVEDFAEVDEDGNVGEHYKESDMQEMLRKKLIMIGMDVEVFGWGDNIRIKSYIEGEKFQLYNKNFPKLLHLSLKKKNLEENLKKVNEFISKHGDLEYFNQELDKDRTQAEEKGKDTLMNRAMEVVANIEDKRTLEDIKDEETEIFKRISRGEKKNITKRTADGPEVVGVRETPATIKDFNNELEFNRYKQWKNGETVNPITEDEIAANRKAYEESETQKRYSEFVSDLPKEEKRRGELFTYKLEQEYISGVKELIKLDDSYNSEDTILEQDIIAFNKNPTSESYYELFNRHLAHQVKLEKLQDLYKKVDADSKAAPLGLQHFTKNYNRLEQLITGFKGVGANIAYTVGYASMFANPGPSQGLFTMEVVRDAYMVPFVNLKEEMNKEAAQYQYSLQVDEIRTMKDAGRWFTSTIVNLIPSLSVAFTGPAALPLFFTMGFGEAHSASEIDQKNAAKALPELAKQLETSTDPFERQIIQQEIDELKRILDIPEWKQVSVGVAHGIAEVVFEKVGTMALLKSVRKGIKMIPPKNIKEGFLWASNTIFKGSLTEGGSEFGTTLFQNMADNLFIDNKNIFDGVFEGGLESFAQGALMGGGIASTNAMRMAKRVITSELANWSERKRLNEIMNSIAKIAGISIDATDAELAKKIGQGGLNKTMLKAIQDLTSESQEISKKIFERMGKGLSLQQIREVGEMNKQMRDLNNKRKEILGLFVNGSINEQQLKEVESSLRVKFDKLSQVREALLTNEDFTKENLKAHDKAHTEIEFDRVFQIMRDMGAVGAQDGKTIRLAEARVIEEYEALPHKDKQKLIDSKYQEITQTGQKRKAIEKSPKLLKQTMELAEETARKEYVNDNFRKRIESGIENSRKFAKESLGIDTDPFKVYGTNQEAADAFLELQPTTLKNASPEIKQQYQDIVNGKNNGVEYKGDIIISMEASISNRAIGVGSHELLHMYAKIMFGEGQGVKLQRELLDSLEKINPSLYIAVKKLLDTNYTESVVDENGKVVKDENGKVQTKEEPAYNREIFNAISDIISEGDIKVNKSAVEKIRDVVVGLFSKTTWGKEKVNKIFNDPKGLLNWVADYNKGAQFGGKVKKDTKIKGAVAPPEDKSIKPSFSVTNSMPPKLTETSSLKEKQDLFSKTDKKLDEVIEMYGKPWNEMNQDEKLVAGFMIGEVWTSWAKKSMESQYGLVPGWNEEGSRMAETLSTGVEKGDNGIPYIVRSWKEDGGRKLTSHIWGLINERAKHVIQLPKHSAFGKQKVVDFETGQFDFDKLNTESGNLANTNTEFDAVTNITGEFRSLLGVKKGGKLFNKVMKSAKNNLNQNRVLLKNPKKYRQALKIEFEKELTPEIGKLFGTQKSKTFKDFISDKENVQTLVNLIGVKYRNRFPIFTESGGTMDTATSDASMTSMKGSFVKSRTAGNEIWIPRKVDDAMMKKVYDVFVNGRETAYKSLKKALANELGLDALHEALRQSPFLEMQHEGVVGQLTESIKRDPDVNFSRTLNELSPTFRAIWILHQTEFFNNLNGQGSFGKAQILASWNNTEGLNGIPSPLKTIIINDFTKILKVFSGVNKKYTPLTEVTPSEALKIGVAEYGNLLNIKNRLGLEKSVGYYFDTKSSLLEYGVFNQDLAAELVEELQKEIENDDGKIIRKALTEKEARKTAANMFIKFYMNTVKNSGKTGSGIWSKKSGVWKKDGKGGENRYNYYETSKDFLQLIRLIDKSVELMGKGKKKQYLGRNINGTLTRIDIKKPTQSVTDYIKGKIDRPARKKAAIESREFIKLIMPLAKKVAKNNVSLGMFMAGMSSNMDTVLRSAADLKYVPVNKTSNKAADLKYEHMIPAKEISSNIIDHYFKGDNTIDIDKLFSTYHVAIIPNTMDTAIGKLFKSRMNIGWKPGDSSYSRYYNQFTLGYSSVAIKDLDIPGSEYGKYHEAVYKHVKDGKLAKPEHLKFQEDINTSFSITNNKVKGISVFDFDDTLAKTKEKIIIHLPYFAPGSTTSATMKLTPSQFAEKYGELEKAGATADFSDFNNVIGAKKGPLAELALKRQGKFGSGDIFVLTARPQASAVAIHKFLKGIGLEIPIENITGLENSTPEAKALWVADKTAQGYNDFYFADDALPNVRAVKDILEQFDVKSKVQQAKVDFNNSISKTFNDIIEQNKGVKSEAEFSDVVAQRRGEKANPFTFYLPSHAEDMKGLIYTLLGKGRKGDKQFEFFKKTILDPYHRGVANIKVAKQQLTNYYTVLVKSHSISKDLKKLTPDGDFTNNHAVRVYLFNKSGWEIPGISKRDQIKLIKHVENNPELLAFANDLVSIPQFNGKYIKPSLHWDASSIVGDLDALSDKVGRKAYLKEFIDNKNEMFNKANMNKLKALYGTNFTEALEDSLYRMENGTNRNFGENRLVNSFMNWINNSVGAVMFINMRSAVLQTISMVNFINWSDNNIIKASIAFGNQPQYWKDFAMIFNSDKLKQRRSGLQINVQEQELANAVKNARNKSSAALSWLLKKGFLPTQIADSFAIAAGGASMYRNRVNTYLKQVNLETGKKYTKQDAEAKAWEDFSDIAEETQQSGDPALISQIQASPLGRVLFAWQNTPFQYNRLIKRAGQDLINRRRTPGQTQFQSDMSNISKIIYYGAVQNFIFNALQSALFAMLPGFGGDEDEDEIKQNEKDLQKQIRIANNMLDTILRGSGLPGAITSTIKNIIMEYNKQEKKGYTADHTYTILQTINLSPPLGSKARKIYSAIQTKRFEKDIIVERGFAPDSPVYEITGKLVSAVFNIPLDRVVSKTQNVTAALDERNEAWQRIATALGWATYDVGVEPYPFHQEIKDTAKLKRKEQGKIKAAETRKKNAILKKKIKRDILTNPVTKKKYYSLNTKERKLYLAEELKKYQNK